MTAIEWAAYLAMPLGALAVGFFVYYARHYFPRAGRHHPDK